MTEFDTIIQDMYINAEIKPQPNIATEDSDEQRNVIVPPPFQQEPVIIQNNTIFYYNDDGNVVVHSQRDKQQHPNRMKNTKYTILSFIPLVLFNQFKFFFNFYFLIIAISQFFPPLKVGFLFTYVAPLAMVLGFTLCKEMYDDLKRFKRDKEINDQVFTKLNLSASQQQNSIVTQSIISQDIKQGDIMIFKHNERIPADCLLLFTNEQQAYIKTDQLDGETDFKARKQGSYMTQQRLISRFTKGVFQMEQPVKNMNDFKGRVAWLVNNKIVQEPISIESSLFAQTSIASNQDVFGLVIYVGGSTKMALNQSKPRAKLGILDNEIDTLAIICFIMQLILAFIFAIIQIPNPGVLDFWLQTFRFLLLFSSIIPISMRVNIEIAKIAYSIFIQRDKNMDKAVVRTSTLPESLGRVNLLMSDKTGTITANKMIFQAISTRSQQFQIKNERLRNVVNSSEQCDLSYVTLEQDILELRNKLRHAYAYEQGEEEITSRVSDSVKFVDQNMQHRRRTKGGVQKQVLSQQQQDLQNIRYEELYNAVRSMAICNSIVPQQSDVFDPLNTIQVKNQKISFNSPSPDEVCFSMFAAQLGLTMIKRNEQNLLLMNPLDQEETINILKVFPFSSRTKRMAIITEINGQIRIDIKGADSIMMSKINAFDKQQYNWVQEQVDILAGRGLRTLVFGHRYLSDGEYKTFEIRYQKALSDMQDRENSIYFAEESILNNIILDSVTGVEDLLQKDVKLTIQQMRKAGIKLFLLTGDKVETSKNIARTTGFIGERQNFHDITLQQFENYKIQQSLGLETNIQPVNLLHRFIDYQLTVLTRNNYQDVLIMDGQILEYIISTIPIQVINKFKFKTIPGKEDAVIQFYEVTKTHPLGSQLAEDLVQCLQNISAMISSRCSPEQKALITKLVSTNLSGKKSKNQILAVGDGGNDVSMIQAADIGVGIRGQEGLQASLAADFSVGQFCDLGYLLFWHGRNSYCRTANMAQFVLQRGITISIIQACFSAAFFYSSVPLFTGWLLIGYSVVFTSLPVVAVVLDKDITIQNAFTYPELYRDTLKGREINFKSFMIWNCIAIFEGVIISVLGQIVVGQNFYNIVGVTFSCLIVVELLTLGFSIYTWTWQMLLAEFLSIVVYFVFMLVLHSVFDYAYIFSWEFWFKCLLVTIAAVIPCFIVKWIIILVSPSTVNKIRSENRRQKKQFKKDGHIPIIEGPDNGSIVI